MSRLIVAASLALFAGVPVLAQVEAPDPEAARIVADCASRKFESAIEIDKDGRKRLTKFKICAAKDSDDAAWVRTLRDAKAKVAARPDISPESKSSIANQLDVEIAKFETASPTPVPPATVAAPVAPPKAVAPAPALASPAPARAAAPARPRLTIRCLDPGESGAGGDCTSLDRATRLQVRADADLAGTSLRFLRRGDRRAEIAIAQLRQGELFRTRLPAELCAGVASTQVEIQVVKSNQVADTLGPYKLRC